MEHALDNFIYWSSTACAWLSAALGAIVLIVFMLWLVVNHLLTPLLHYIRVMHLVAQYAMDRRGRQQAKLNAEQNELWRCKCGHSKSAHRKGRKRCDQTDSKGTKVCSCTAWEQRTAA